ncbi:MAG: hypothetical protein KDJ29_00960 [Hyphomicrobiales bacterium]|nr:hypothetical protein [Hyphomicrobiales bacterium]
MLSLAAYGPALAAIRNPCTSVAKSIVASNQNDTLQCWAVAITSKFDLEASAIAGRALKLSPRYLFYVKTLLEVSDAIVEGRLKPFKAVLSDSTKAETVFYEQGGDLSEAVEAALRGGAMPYAAYPGFPKKDLRMFRALNRLMAQYHRDPKIIRKREIVEARVRTILDRYLGRPPARFTVTAHFPHESADGKGAAPVTHRYDPVQFRRIFLPSLDRSRAIEVSYVAGAKPAREAIPGANGRSYLTYVTGEQKTILALLEAAMRSRKAVLITYPFVDEAHASDTRIGFQIHGIGPKARRRLVERARFGHYVLDLEGRFDKHGRLNRLLVKNTFGSTRGNRGGLNWVEADYLSLIDGVEVPDALWTELVMTGLLPD